MELVLAFRYNAEMVSKEDSMLLQNKGSEVAVLDEDGIAVGIGAMLVTVKYKEEKRLQLGFKQNGGGNEAGGAMCWLRNESRCMPRILQSCNWRWLGFVMPNGCANECEGTGSDLA
ncbi:hypothetical protein C5167_041989 [Papaver somniferum]|nr:hypothetical protein C5167_041989 [Papaver somniferum]